ncbi:Aminotransferase class-V [Fragilaria crotonensis]|nr:Aminotransferase class-V [Fragilaria crotonensis]
MEANGNSWRQDTIYFEVTGCAAYSRIQPLLPCGWIDSTATLTLLPTTAAAAEKQTPLFLWENAPRPETRDYRDQVLCYSHLPNGLSVLDSKWALARLFRDGEMETDRCALPSHCFRGKTGFQQFCDKVGMFKSPNPEPIEEAFSRSNFPDLLDVGVSIPGSYPPAPTNLWVIKDAMSNGAGGVWMVNPDNAAQFLTAEGCNLIEEHRYVAQKYAWPPVLYGGKKCHVRVYGLFTADHKAFVHRKCFLHVANEDFTAGNYQEASVHITNCCANSHDKKKFAGEICADLVLTETSETDCGRPIISLSRYYDSIVASVALLAERSFPFLKGGEMNGGFEYLGMDFILSEGGKAYLLEVNAPPSQDTATGLSHAENLHNAVISDLISLWVMPRVTGALSQVGGWNCVFSGKSEESGILPSKAVILNKIRWAIFERKAMKQDEDEGDVIEHATPEKVEIEPKDLSPTCISNYARLQFPYYASNEHLIFMENAGGAQVPYSVIDAMQESLSCRNRSVNGFGQRESARVVARTLIGCGPQQCIYFGANATSLLQSLAPKLSQTWQSCDEIILSTENHLANITPWVEAAEQVGVTIKWWPVGSNLVEILSDRVKLVALSHASNVLGQVRDIEDIVARVRRSCPHAQIVVDGVAAVPHIPTNNSSNTTAASWLDSCWYVVSCHKLFGPHLGILCGPLAYEGIEVGTVNYESCAGLMGLAEYFVRLATLEGEQAASQSQTERKDRREAALISFSSANDMMTREHVLQAYRRIAMVEDSLVECLIGRLSVSSNKVRLLNSKVSSHGCTRRLPIVAFCHESISAEEIVKELAAHKVAVRQGSFLSTEQLQSELGFEHVVRLSLAHYNTVDEVRFAIDRLEEMPGW